MEIRIPLSQEITSRIPSLDKDGFSANCYWEKEGNAIKVYKRPGLASVSLTGDAISPGEAQGMCVFNNTIVVVVNNGVYQVTAYGVVTKIGTLSSTGFGGGEVNSAPLDSLSVNGGTYSGTVLTQVYFASTANDAYLFFHDKFNAYYITNSSSTVTSVSTNVSTFAAGAVYLDGYVVVADINGRLYSSGLEDPTSWNPLDFITAQSDPDPLVGIVRQLNYIVAFGQKSTEFFYNNANPTGSPFAVQPSFKQEVGCSNNGSSIAKIDQSVLWVGTSARQGNAVYLLNNGTTPTVVSTPAVERWLNRYISSKAFAYSIRMDGHVFYVLSIESAGLSFVYDIGVGAWYIWSTVVDEVWGTFDAAYFVPFSGQYYTVCKDDGRLYTLSMENYKDIEDKIYFRAVTELIDHGTTHRKFFKRAELVGDKVKAKAKISHSDNDYRTWSNPRTVDLYNERAQVFNLGSGRRRAWKIEITDDVPVCIEGLEVEYDAGHKEEGA